jgi:hypothetical protein
MRVNYASWESNWLRTNNASGGDSITQSRFSLGGGRQSILLDCDCLSTGVLYFIGFNRIEFDVLREFRREIGIRIDRVHRTDLDTRHAIDAFIGMDDYLAVHFVEARDGADFYAVGEFTSVTFLGDYMRHGNSVIEVP